MIKGLRGATIWSEEVDNLLPFYRDLLGLPVMIQIPGFVVLGQLAPRPSRSAPIATCTVATRTRPVTWSASAPTTSTRTGSA